MRWSESNRRVVLPLPLMLLLCNSSIKMTHAARRRALMRWSESDRRAVLPLPLMLLLCNSSIKMTHAAACVKHAIVRLLLFTHLPRRSYLSMDDTLRCPVAFHACCACIAPSAAKLARAFRAQVRCFLQNKRKRRAQTAIIAAQLARANSH